MLKPKVLVIDDSEIVLEVTRGALEGAGFEVVTHDRPAGCVALILQEKPDLVLMDVNMPGLAGDTVAGVFAKAQPRAETIVLLYSSLSAEVLQGKVLAAGAHGYIQKSGDMFGLVRELNRWLKKAGGGGRMSSGQMRAAPVFSSEDGRSSGTQRAAAAIFSSAPPTSDGYRSSGTLRVDAPKVLLVDDEMSILSGYRRQLQNEDLSIEFALSGSQALRRMLSDTPPDVVVCDLMLPEISGVEVYERALASQPSYRKRFIIASGASTLPAYAEFLAKFGGSVLKKPVSTTDLTLAVRACLSSVRPALKSGARG